MSAKIIAGLELGANEFTVAAGHLQDRQKLVVQTVDSIEACGMKNGVLSEPIECADAIARLIRQAERSLPSKVPSVLVAFPSNALKSYNASASVPVPDSGSGISRRDVERVIGACRAHHVEYDRQVLHTFERGFALDGQAGIKDPVGLFGTKLTVELHLVTALNLAVQNLARVLNRAGLEVEGFVLPSVATADVVLSDLDRDLGVTLIRIGDHQTEVLLFSDGMLRETHLIPGGVEELVEGFSRALKLPRAATDQLLGQLHSIEERPERASIPLQIKSGALERTLPQGEVVYLLAGKVKEFLHKVRRRLMTSPTFLDSAAGVVMAGHLTGLEGFLEMAERMLNLPVRLGAVREVEFSSGIRPRTHHTTTVGLLAHGVKRRISPARPWPLPPWLRGLDRVRQLVHEYF